MRSPAGLYSVGLCVFASAGAVTLGECGGAGSMLGAWAMLGPML